MSEPRTHYQISLTARQAVGLFVGLLLALGLAFFFGLMTGYSGREARATERIADARFPAERTPIAASESLPPVETGVPVAGAGASPKAQVVSTPPPPEPTTPATLHPFEDSAEDEVAEAPAAGSRTSVVGAGPSAVGPKAAPPAATKAPASSTKPAAPAAGRVWVQAASLSSHEEANALGTRLSKHGFHSVVLPAPGPRGRVYRVRVGPYRSEEEASRAMARLTKQEKIREPWIVPDGK